MKKISIFFLAILLFSILSGCGHSHEWREPTCQQPRHCSVCGKEDGEILAHVWNEASCELAKTCILCGMTEGTALGHSWIVASCQQPQHCNVCGKNVGVSIPHNWKPAHELTPQMCLDCGTMVPFETPESGTVFLDSDLVKGSELTIHTADDDACYVKLKDENGEDVFSFFVRAGESISVPVPFGNYFVYFAYGTDWYGPEYVFGDDTSYGKDEEICDFENYTWEYTFVNTADGNFKETPIDSDEF